MCDGETSLKFVEEFCHSCAAPRKVRAPQKKLFEVCGISQHVHALREKAEEQLVFSHRVTHGLASSAERFRATWW
jgi:hypothetical protein